MSSIDIHTASYAVSPISLPYNRQAADPIVLNPGQSQDFEPISEVRPKPLTPKDNADARSQLVHAGQQFEAYFISYLLKVMRETVPQGAIANKQGAYFHSFYDQEIGMRAADSGGIGIARMVEDYAEKYFSPPPAQPSSSTR